VTVDDLGKAVKQHTDFAYKNQVDVINAYGTAGLALRQLGSNMCILITNQEGVKCFIHTSKKQSFDFLMKPC